MHLIQYQTRDDIDAIIHAHTTYATVLACLREPLPASHYMIAVAGKDVRIAEYATYGTKELAVNAFNIVEEVEYCAKIYCLAKNFGEPVVLPDEEMELMAEKFKTYGQRK
ncbi:L-fuculose phosphate aldolase [Streptococcus pneumoniae]|nr:L-fuculose phosphate aldolase [Streptococcus pneumoniae]